MQGVIGREENPTVVIALRESRLRVMAACAATIIAGWTTYAGSRVGGAAGWFSIVWAAACLWSLLWCAACVARACGLRKARTVWMFTGGYALHLPFLSLVSSLAGPSPTGVKSVFALSAHAVPLAIGSIAILATLAVVGYVVEQPAPAAPRGHFAG